MDFLRTTLRVDIKEKDHDHLQVFLRLGKGPPLIRGLISLGDFIGADDMGCPDDSEARSRGAHISTASLRYL